MAFPQLTQEQKEQIFRLICSHWSDNPERAVEEALGALPDGAAEMVVQSYASSKPLYDAAAVDPLPDHTEPALDPSRQYFDREHFPTDLPEDLIKELMRTQKQQN